jgi:hypothetical protein
MCTLHHTHPSNKAPHIGTARQNLSECGRRGSGPRGRERWAEQHSLEAVHLELQRRHLVAEHNLVRPTLVRSCGSALAAAPLVNIAARRGGRAAVLRTCGCVEQHEAGNDEEAEDHPADSRCLQRVRRVQRPPGGARRGAATHRRRAGHRRGGDAAGRHARTARRARRQHALLSNAKAGGGGGGGGRRRGLPRRWPFEPAVVVASHQRCLLPACGGKAGSAAAGRAPPAAHRLRPLSSLCGLVCRCEVHIGLALSMRPRNASILAIFVVRS